MMTILLVIAALVGLYMVQKQSNETALKPIRIKKDDEQRPR